MLQDLDQVSLGSILDLPQFCYLLTIIPPFIFIQTSGTVELPALVNSPSSRGTSASPKPLPKAPGSKSSSPSPSTSNKNATSTVNTSTATTVSSATQDLLGLGECSFISHLWKVGTSFL